jgi:hypothetical protein
MTPPGGALGERLVDVAVGQAVAQLPAHRDRVDLAREAVTSADDRADLELITGQCLQSELHATNATAATVSLGQDRNSMTPARRRGQDEVAGCRAR